MNVYEPFYIVYGDVIKNNANTSNVIMKQYSVVEHVSTQMQMKFTSITIH